MSRPQQAFVRFAWITLAITIVVIVWGAVVRATGAGAGCGSHWPSCNGQVIPLAPSAKTIIEYVHRLTAGLAMVLALVLLVRSRRVFPAGHRARTWALAAFVFMLIEAAIGAGIVLLELVEDNASALRAGYIAVHLTNTMLLVGAMTGVIHAGQKSEVRSQKKAEARRVKSQVLSLVLMIVVAAAGAIVALGDTLFPSASLAEGLAADLDPASHFLIRLRSWHPILAVAASLVTVISFRAALITTLILGQVGLGVINLMMLAPLTLQMAHLLLSNVLWTAMVWAVLETIGNDRERAGTIGN